MRHAVAIVCLALAACGVPKARPPPAPAPAGPPAAAGKAATPAPPSGARFHLDPTRSELRILVYRAGPMASLGHNHVIATHALQGWATFDGNPSAAAFAFTIPVADFSVDDEKSRAEEGAEFAEPVAEEAKSGTLHNMLGPAVLNAIAFPVLSIRSAAVRGSGREFEARIVVEVAGHASTLEVPFVLDAEPGRLIASGEATVSQSSLGLEPFSIFLGALKVKDDLRVKFKLVAQAG